MLFTHAKTTVFLINGRIRYLDIQIDFGYNRSWAVIGTLTIKNPSDWH